MLAPQHSRSRLHILPLILRVRGRILETRVTPLREYPDGTQLLRVELVTDSQQDSFAVDESSPAGSFVGPYTEGSCAQGYCPAP